VEELERASKIRKWNNKSRKKEMMTKKFNKFFE
jgi:hypothetical protein